MKTQLASNVVYALFAVFVLSSCKKDPVRDVPNSYVEKVNAWIDGRKAAEPKNAEKIGQLQAHLNYAAMREEQHNNVEKLLIIPIDDAYKAAWHISKDARANLLVAVNPTGEIAYAQIVLYTPEKEQSTLQLSSNTSYNFGNAKLGLADGKYVFCTLTGSRIRELKYIDGNLREQGTVTTKTPSQGAAKLNSIKRNAGGCTTWWLITTYYDQNGAVLYETEQFLYSTGYCGGSTPPEENQIPQPDENGGWNEFDRTSMRYVDVKPGIPGNDTTIVRGHAYFHGSYGLFDDAAWYGSQPMWMPRDWTYTQTSGIASYSNAGTPRASISFTGAMTTATNHTYVVGLSRQYTYTQAFTH